jgi:Na+/H+-dicarboxylate symporter
MLALIVFSILVGFAASTPEEGKQFIQFLQSGEAVFMRFFSIIMYYAPIGFFAYFATLVSELGPTIMAHYFRIAVFYSVFALLYFVIAFTLYSFLAGKMTGVTLFWKHVFLPGVTSIATCSSAASIPANLYACKKMHVSPEIYETVIPLGAMLHKDGSVIGGVVKIAFLFGLFHLDFSSASVLFTAFGVSLLVGTVMGAIPSGGMLGELLILSVYGFPPSALIAMAAISIVIDPLATLLNVTGNCVSSMMIARCVDGNYWFNHGGHKSPLKSKLY